LTEQTLRLIREDAQLLTRTKKLSALQVVQRLLGVQAQLRPAGFLAIRARSAEPTSAAIGRSLVKDRSLVWTWAMRMTLHLISAKDYGWLVPLTATPFFSTARRRLKQQGLSGDQPDKAMRMIGPMLAREGPLTRPEIAERLARKRIPTDGQAMAHLMWLAVANGIAIRGPNRNGRETYVLVHDWLGPQQERPREDALKELAVRYLKSRGPAAPEDLAKWSGMSLGDVRQGWAQIANRLSEVTVAGTKLWMLRSQSTEAPNGIVRLLPAYDEYLLSWKSRKLVLAEEHESKIYPGGGILGPSLLVDGKLIGTWSIRKSARSLRIAVRPFGRLSSNIRTALAAEVADIERFEGTSADLTIG
jgi:hypothetical protein